MEHIINIGIQVIPVKYTGDKYSIIDQAIEVVKVSGFNYIVTPFETVIEAKYNEAMELVSKMKDSCYRHGAEELIVNIRIHASHTKDIFMGDKTDKHAQ